MCVSSGPSPFCPTVHRCRRAVAFCPGSRRIRSCRAVDPFCPDSCTASARVVICSDSCTRRGDSAVGVDAGGRAARTGSFGDRLPSDLPSQGGRPCAHPSHPPCSRMPEPSTGCVTLAQLNKARVTRRRRTELLEVSIPRTGAPRGVPTREPRRGIRTELPGACLALPDAVVSGPSAGSASRAASDADGTRPRAGDDQAVRLTDVVIHRTTALSPADWTTRKEDGIRVLRPVRLAVDLARLPRRPRSRVRDRAADRPRTRVDPGPARVRETARRVGP